VGEVDRCIHAFFDENKQMNIVMLIKLIHILSAFWFISGLLGRGLVLSKASRTADIQTVTALVQLGGRFERQMVIPGSMVVFLVGLLIAWMQGWPIFGFFQGGSSNWVLASLVFYLSLVPVITWIFTPRGKVFDKALQAAQAQGKVTPELTIAFGDKVVAAAHAYELLAVTVIIILMVTKPF
jgi:uncharacterized membrane protein